MLNLNKCYLVFALSMNMIGHVYCNTVIHLKLENNCCSIYLNKTFDGHTPNENSLLDLDRSDTLLGNVVISKKFLHTRKIMVMHGNERGEYCPRTLVVRKRKR